MKKKLVLSLLVIVALFTFTACGSKENGKDNKVDNNVSKDVTEKKESKEELVYEDTNHGYKTTFKYNKDDFVITKSGISSNTNLNEVYLESKNLDINMRLSYTFYDHAKAYSSMKASKKSLPTYKEYTWNGIEGFMYGMGENYITFMIPLELNTSDELILTVLITPLTNPKDSVLKVAQGSTIQDFLNTIVYEKK